MDRRRTDITESTMGFYSLILAYICLHIRKCAKHIKTEIVHFLGLELSKLLRPIHWAHLARRHATRCPHIRLYFVFHNVHPTEFIVKISLHPLHHRSLSHRWYVILHFCQWPRFMSLVPTHCTEEKGRSSRWCFENIDNRTEFVPTDILLCVISGWGLWRIFISWPKKA